MTQSRPDSPVLEVRDLTVTATGRRGRARIVSDVSFDIARGEVFAVIGETGSGKSTAAMAVADLLGPDVQVGGSIRFAGADLRALSHRDRRALMGRKIAQISQDALSGLNPSTTVGYQIAEMLMVHLGTPRRAAFDRARELLELTGIPAAAERVHQHPHQFSGGMRQRALIAMALALEPDLLVADEPTTALDATVKAQILQLLSDLRERFGMAIMIITHDMGVVARIADRMMVMYAGRGVEIGAVGPCFRDPGHPYTRALLDTIPRLDRLEAELRAIDGAPPSPFAPVSGCAFHPRCPMRRELCFVAVPQPVRVASGASVLCHFATGVAQETGRSHGH